MPPRKSANKKRTRRHSTQSQLTLKKCTYCQGPRSRRESTSARTNLQNQRAQNRKQALDHHRQQRRERNKSPPIVPRNLFSALVAAAIRPDSPMDIDYAASADVDLGLPEPEDGPIDVESTHPGDRPFAPFRTFADYKFASRAIKRRMPKNDVDEDLRDMHGGVYSTDSFVTFRNHRDLNRSLVAARLTNVAVEFRDPWKLMKRWICDETLASVSTWYSQEKFLCLNGEIDFSNPLYDEPWTGTMWREIDDQLPEKAKYPPCFVGLHIWLDKGLVSTKVKMHPILVRGCWIESATRNGSGNGGGTLAGFVRMPPELREIDPKTLSGSMRAEYDQLKRQIYYAQRSRGGETLKFGDGVLRTAYPGILIESMDFEEIAAWLAIRNSRALHPCPQCLVHKDDLHRLSQEYPARTAVSMKRVLTDAPRGPKTARQEYLREYGLHDFVHFLWEFAHSELYKAVGFDKLHFFDGGEFGRHAWVLLKEYLQNNQLASKFNQWMDQFPRWRNLKHIFGATNIRYSEGQTFVDILKFVVHRVCAIRYSKVMTILKGYAGPITFEYRMAQTR
ncbi:hypothetical protein R3P38DRAFT_3209633 [Favolaschia claudopus]|uniref:Uncharacterized protein n=1 Tax=Favolaschia claudopus TaxID=2862362 RepID=A0AAW0AK16_9AGAR